LIQPQLGVFPAYTAAIVAFLLGRVVARFGTIRLAMVTLSLLEIGALTLIFGGLMSAALLFGFLLLRICGATLPAIAAAARENVSERAGIGSTVRDTSRQTGEPFGVAAFGTLIAVAQPSVVLAAVADTAFVDCLAGPML
jgi:DHA2 family methylenomycin A resistance protein-like MFS transporter